MKKLTKSPLVTLLITLSALTVSATTYAGVATGAPKLKEDGMSEKRGTAPTSGSTKVPATPDAANSAAHTAARPPIKVVADRWHYSDRCRLEGATAAQSYRVPMATRWWRLSKTHVKFCVVAGAIKLDASGTQPYQLNVVLENGATVLMTTAAIGGTFAVGGTFGASSSLWSTKENESSMGTSEFCSSETVKDAERLDLRLKLNNVTDSGSCRIFFAPTPWIGGREQVVPKNPLR